MPTQPEPRLPAVALTGHGTTVYIVTDVRHERFIAVARTLDSARLYAEADPEATPYFSDAMVWAEAAPLPPEDGPLSHTAYHGVGRDATGNPYSRRHWIGKVVTEPHQPPREFRIQEVCLLGH